MERDWDVWMLDRGTTFILLRTGKRIQEFGKTKHKGLAVTEELRGSAEWRSGYQDGDFVERHQLLLTLEAPFFVEITYEVEYEPRLDEPSNQTALVFKSVDTKTNAAPAVPIQEWFPGESFRCPRWWADRVLDGSELFTTHPAAQQFP